jgi:putative transposase
MSSSYSGPSGQSTFSLLSRAFAFCAGARFTGLLDPAFFQSHADRHAVRFGSGQHDVFDPGVTLWAWLTQTLSPAKSCVAAVSRVMALCFGIGRVICSAATGAFCKARAKLSEAFLRELAIALGQRVEAQAPDTWKWHGRTVKLADGALLQMLDTPENLKQFPQQRSQKKGTSYACMRVVTLLALATGVLSDAACGAYKGKGTGEMSLLLEILESIAPCDVLVGDRYYGSYLLLALLMGRGSDGCFRLNASRQKEFHQGQSLGEDDYLQTWVKPRRPRTIDKQTWDSLPDTICVRVLRWVVKQRGFRTKEVYVVTTLTDAGKYSKADIADLYCRRWNVEVDLRSLKQELGLKMLRCKTPALVRAELWTHLLGYNLTRCVMAQAAYDKGLRPRDLSFSGARDTLNAFRWLLSCTDKDPEQLRQVISTALSSHRVGKRPGRYEPREVKHRQRKYKELKKSRQQRRQELEQEQGQEQEQEKKSKRRKGGGKDRATGR